MYLVLCFEVPQLYVNLYKFKLTFFGNHRRQQDLQERTKNKNCNVLFINCSVCYIFNLINYNEININKIP